MKIKHLLIFLIISALGIEEVGAQVRFTGGLEWGYTATAFNYHSLNYLSTDGVRVDDTDYGFDYKSNGAILGNAGVYLGKHFALTANSGWIGIYEERRVVPLTLRTTYFIQDICDKGFKLFLEAGTALPSGQRSFKNKKIYTGKAGFGYRVPVYGHFCIDVNAALQYTTDHPLYVIDRYTRLPVSQADLRRSNRNYAAATFTIALCF